ncbi:hypothetical protein Vretimale_13325, partial [Volvox reticuliferus]
HDSTSNSIQGEVKQSGRSQGLMGIALCCRDGAGEPPAPAPLPLPLPLLLRPMPAAFSRIWSACSITSCPSCCGCSNASRAGRPDVPAPYAASQTLAGTLLRNPN